MKDTVTEREVAVDCDMCSTALALLPVPTESCFSET